ncbi:Sec-independent protein translocase protein TatB [Bordetella tumulicola]|uniref:Sec-independent protein translocase protein TatB n=1 Tax=Bordetella tumulicola TaxID=1649133 RepID=UPI0039EF4631
MFDVSFTELMVIGVIALIVIGPERLPKVARTVGHLLGRAQRYVNDVKSDIKREVELDELRSFKKEMDDAASSVTSSLRDTENSIRTGLNDTAQTATKEISDLKKEVESPAGVANPSTSESTSAGATTAATASVDVSPAGATAPADTAPDAPAAPPQPKTPITP